LLGTLPYNGISVLPSLEYLGVEGCNLYGRLPELTGLENITSIRFGGNDLSGTIPATIGQLAKLEVLELWDNDIFGTVPSFAGNQNGLREIDLSFNIGIIGNLMDILNKLPESLMDFRCEQCGLVGQIPGATILKFKNLTAIQVEENGLTGSLPTEFGTLTMMSRLSLGSNSLIGSIPTQIANLPRLEIFDVWGNQLTGIVPSFAQNDGYLNYFDIEENQLRGSLQGLIRSLPPESLSKFYAGYNSLTGFIPSDIAYFPKLTLFYIRWQNIGGTVPLQMAFMNKLEHMNIEGNSISGNFPADIAKMTNMVDLSIHANRFKGSLDTACDVNRIPEELTADCANPVAVSCSCCSACWSQNSNSWA
jgi:Leucine-rich repeat (LRR) protein